jgi:hypothetical protein
LTGRAHRCEFIPRVRITAASASLPANN